MKRPMSIYGFANITGILLIIGFIIRFGADYFKYQYKGDSFPFFSYLVSRSLSYLLPGLICIIISIYIKKRNQSK